MTSAADKTGRTLHGGARPDLNDVFDVIVVGSGAAGAVVAARVSEDPHRTVLLLEAGPDYPRALDLPEDLVNGHDNSYDDHDWALRYSPSGERDDRFPRGRVTGGSTSVNTTIALRGIPADFDDWSAAGNPEWAWNATDGSPGAIARAHNRLERDLDFGHLDHHGDAGPISIRRWRDDELVPTQAAFLDACEGYGFPRIADVNDPEPLGAGVMAMNKLGRLRISTAIGYLSSARYRENLRIEADTTVARLSISNGRCTGVETTDGRDLRAHLVVVAAGAVLTPGILARSGIGDPDELASIGVDTVLSRPGVGANLSDHPATAVLLVPRFPELCAPELPLVQTICRYTSEGSSADFDVNIELMTRARGRGDEVYFMLAPSLEYVEGRGRVRQRSADPSALPAIEPGFGANAADLDRHARSLADALGVARQSALTEFIEEIRFPDPARSSHQDLVHVLQRTSASGYHPCGTARMGPVDDPGAVVDQYGRSHGLTGLVVADASIMPSVPRANINLSTIAIGEVIGEWIRTRPDLYST